uniref:acyl carrier protein n=1 Tax=Lithodesmioides polymorpha TaxID=1003075 RepID=UPI002236F4DA|nr:acyl carrier protein [Lithodesmioides polymorpha]YP_010537124.1 acyl carrier protein [Lithodesmioides polymorpha]UYC30843.1 acyl carrier protein [Lithodesmioides polymorpha]UYC30911.1 acyl carrier protein [Lithodesmioides polymorpha]
MSGNFEKLQSIISDQLSVSSEEVKLESKFIDDLGADSLDVVELVMALEDEFEIEIDDETAGEMTSVQDAMDYIEKQM